MRGSCLGLDRMKPLCIDLFCGLGGWTEGFLAEGYECIGFDIEEHEYGEHRYPAQLVLQDVRTLHGRQFKDASIIVASSPCQKYSYMAMPWTRAKDLAKWYRDPLHPERLVELNELFNQPRRIQLEAIEAAGGRFIPLIQENVRGAIPWVGRSQWHYGSYHLWGDVPALMPVAAKAAKVGGFSWSDFGKPGYVGQGFNHNAERATKNTGGSWFNIPGPGGITANNNPTRGPIPDGVKGSRGGWFNDDKRSGKSTATGRLSQSGSKSKTRKAASARIAKIPFPLAQWIARVNREALESAA